MAKIDDILIPSLTLEEIASDGSTLTNPSADHRRLFLGEDGLLHLRDSAGTVTDIGGASGSVATDAIWDAAGDLAVGSGANTAARLALGATNGMALRRVSGAVAWDLPPGHEFDYAQVTSGNINVTATAEASADTLITAGAVSYDGSTVICLEFFTPVAVSQATAGNNLIFYLYDGSSSVGIIAQYTNSASSTQRRAVYAKVRLTPSNASHTYSIRATTSAGTGVVGNGAGGSSGAYWPMYIRQTKA